MSSPTPGMAAHVAFAAAFTAGDDDTSAVVAWDELPQRSRTAWEAAALSASDEISAHVDLEREAKIQHLAQQLAAVTAERNELLDRTDRLEAEATARFDSETDLRAERDEAVRERDVLQGNNSILTEDRDMLTAERDRARLIIDAIDDAALTDEGEPFSRGLAKADEINGDLIAENARLKAERDKARGLADKHLTAELNTKMKLAAVTAGRDRAYRERAELVALLAALWPSQICDITEDWPVIFIETPCGQLSWHLSQADIDVFGHVPQSAASASEKWDGHTTEEKYFRVAMLARDGKTDASALRAAITELADLWQREADAALNVGRRHRDAHNPEAAHGFEERGDSLARRVGALRKLVTGE